MVLAAAKEAQIQAATQAGETEAAKADDKAVISDPTVLGNDQEGSASAASTYPAEAMPLLRPTLPAAAMPATPAMPPPPQ